VGGGQFVYSSIERERKEAEGNNDPGQGRGTGVVSTVRADASKGFRFLIEEINTIFVPLQQANSWAFEMYQKQGQNELNESALWKGQALFQSALRGVAYKMVTKTFQHKVWKNLLNDFERLDASDKRLVEELLGFHSPHERPDVKLVLAGLGNLYFIVLRLTKGQI